MDGVGGGMSGTVGRWRTELEEEAGSAAAGDPAASDTPARSLAMRRRRARQKSTSFWGESLSRPAARIVRDGIGADLVFKPEPAAYDGD